MEITKVTSGGSVISKQAYSPEWMPERAKEYWDGKDFCLTIAAENGARKQTLQGWVYSAAFNQQSSDDLPYLKNDFSVLSGTQTTSGSMMDLYRFPK